MPDSIQDDTNPIAIEKSGEVAAMSDKTERDSTTSQNYTIVNETTGISDDIVIGQSIFRTNSPQPQNSSLSSLSMIVSQTSETSNDSVPELPDPVFKNFVQNADILKSLSSLSQPGFQIDASRSSSDWLIFIKLRLDWQRLPPS